MATEIIGAQADTGPRQVRLPFPTRAVKLLALLGLFIGLGAGYYASGSAVTLAVNGRLHQVRAHQLAVEAVLAQIGLTLRAEDLVSPARTEPLTSGQVIDIQMARPVVVTIGPAHGQSIYTHKQTPREIYRELGIDLVEADDVFVSDVPWTHDQPLPITLPGLPPGTVALKTRLEALRPEPVRLRLHQAIPVQLLNGDQQTTFLTTHQTVGDVLVARNIPLYLGDAISPDLSQPLQANMTITIQRSVPVVIHADGRPIRTRTLGQSVGDVLAQEQVALIGQDHTLPPEPAAVEREMEINVVRVNESLEIEKETTDFETIWVDDTELELDRQVIRQGGQEGVTKTRTRVRYENGQEVFREEEDTWLEYEPADKIIAYGTKVVIRTVDTPAGPMEYWRKIRMLATGYTAATSGKSEDHPTYGITRSGLRAGHGIVAIDPRVIPLLSDVYVPGYGEATAGDTGGAILGKRIDLGFEEDEPIPPWYTWTDVYVLTPAPPRNEIRYVLPQWPEER
jgi:uncharacterized protein YabE (DUF348 family)